MSNEIIDKWISLLSEVRILQSPNSQVETVSKISSDFSDFTAYEASQGIEFPEDYKAFCKIFGQGAFGTNWIFIYAPDKDKIEMQIADQEDAFYAFEDYLCYGGNSAFVSTLNESYLFGLAQDVIFIFVKDQILHSHIYAVDDGGGIYDFGKDFFGFVKNCCLNKGIERRFPKLLDYMVPLNGTIDQLVAPTFTPQE